MLPHAPRRPAGAGAAALSLAQTALRTHPVASAVALLLACALALLALPRRGGAGASAGTDWSHCEATVPGAGGAPVWSSGAGARVLVTGAADGRVALWDVSRGASLACAGHGAPVSGVTP